MTVSCGRCCGLPLTMPPRYKSQRAPSLRHGVTAGARRCCHAPWRIATKVPLDGVVARAAGLLCGWAGTADVIDASVVVTAAGIARHEDVAIATSDPDDMRRLLSVLDVAARVVQV